jgi:hypothetical protein
MNPQQQSSNHNKKKQKKKKGKFTFLSSLKTRWFLRVESGEVRFVVWQVRTLGWTLQKKNKKYFTPFKIKMIRKW